MARRAGWARLLNEYILRAQERYQRNGFSWGRMDCCHFAGNWVQLCTGIDVLADYRGKYRTEEEAFALLSANDGTLYDALVKRLGEPVHPSHAQRGDIAYSESLKACGIFFTSGARTMALFLGEGGFALHRAKDTDHAFRV